jgi:hypothetical protein
MRGTDSQPENALEHGGEYPDDMPQAIRGTDPQGRSFKLPDDEPDA